MAFATKISSGCLRHLKLVGCLLRKRLTNGVHGHRGNLLLPPPQACDMAVVTLVSELFDYKKTTIQFTPTTYLMAVTAKDHFAIKKVYLVTKLFNNHCTPFLHNTGCRGGCRFKNITNIKKGETAKNNFRQCVEK